MGEATSSLGISRKMILLIGIPLILAQINYKISGDHFTFCLFKNMTGSECYGCGLLRGISAFLHLDFSWVYHLNRLNIVTIPLLIFVYIREWMRWAITLFLHLDSRQRRASSFDSTK